MLAVLALARPNAEATVRREEIVVRVDGVYGLPVSLDRVVELEVWLDLPAELIPRVSASMGCVVDVIHDRKL